MVFAAVACFFSALAGTLGKQDDHAENSRNTATKISKDSLNECGYNTGVSTDLTQNPSGGDNSSSIFFSNNPIFETEPSPTTTTIRQSI